MDNSKYNYRFNEEALREIAMRFPDFDNFTENIDSTVSLALDDSSIVGGYRYIKLAEDPDTYEALEMVPYMRTEMTDPACIRHMVVSTRGWATPIISTGDNIGIGDRVRVNLLLFVGKSLTVASVLRLAHDPDNLVVEIGLSDGALAEKAKLAFATYLMSEA